MGNKTSSPFPNYESASNHLNPMELNHLQKAFKMISRDSETISLSNFTQVAYCRTEELSLTEIESELHRIIFFFTVIVTVIATAVPATTKILRVQLLLLNLFSCCHCHKIPPSEERSEFYHNFTHSHIFSYFINIFDQNCVVSVPSSQYIRKNVLPKLFITIDTKKDNVIDFEEYVCAVALFRIGSTEEKIRST